VKTLSAHTLDKLTKTTILIPYKHIRGDRRPTPTCDLLAPYWPVLRTLRSHSALWREHTWSTREVEVSQPNGPDAIRDDETEGDGDTNQVQKRPSNQHTHSMRHPRPTQLKNQRQENLIQSNGPRLPVDYRPSHHNNQTPDCGWQSAKNIT
jgi:hypothetical protein